MIQKPFEMSQDVLQNAALHIRTPDFHPQKSLTSQHYFRSLAGYVGEKEAFYQAQFLPFNDYLLFHNVRLSDQNSFFQMDILILTMYFIAILEVKNYKGSVYFNDLGQIVQMKEDKKLEVYDNPVSQVERQAFQLQNWLYRHGYFDIPIIPFVVFSSSMKLIKPESVSKEIMSKIISVSNIVRTIRGLSDDYSRAILSKKALFSVSKKIVDSHTPIKRDLLSNMNVPYSDLMKGVHCPKCHHIPIIKAYGKWTCPKCAHEGKDLALDSFNHYYLLVDEYITNSQAREFLGICSENAMKNYFKEAGYEKIGDYKHTKYKLEYIKPKVK